MANNKESEIDVGDLSSGFDMTSSAASFIANARNDAATRNHAGSDRPIESLLISKTHRRLNFDEIPATTKSIVTDNLKPTIFPLISVAATTSCPTTPFSSTALKNCSKATPSPTKSLGPISASSIFDSNVVDDKYQQLRELFSNVRGEFEQCLRITDCCDTCAVVCESKGIGCVGAASISEEAGDELNVVKTLNVDQIRDIYEAECFKRLYGERKIRLLQKRVFDLEQRLTISNAMIDRRSTFLARAESSVCEILDCFIERDRRGQSACSNLSDENAKLKSNVQLLSDSLKTLSENYEKANRNFLEISSKLRESEQTVDELRAENDSLRRSVKAAEETNETLLMRVSSLDGDKQRLLAQEREATEDFAALNKMLQEANDNVQRLKNELNSEKTAHRLRVEEVDRLSKVKFSELALEYEKRLAKSNEEYEVKKASEFRRLKIEFESSLKTYDDMYAKVKHERDEALSKLKELERGFDENLRIMYSGMQQRLTAKYYELVSEFAAPPAHQHSASSAPGHHGFEANSYSLADEFLDRLQNVEPLSTPRHATSTHHQSAPTGNVQTVSNQRLAVSSRPENSQHFLKNFAKSQPNPPTPADPPGKF